MTDRCIDFLRRRDREMPFFLHASYVRPHPPYDAPACYFDMYRQMDLEAPASGDWDDREAVQKTGRVKDAVSAPQDAYYIRTARAGYYACVTHLDHQIGRLLERLPEDTVVLFTGDHGEMLGDHALCRKGLPYDGSARVPLLIAGAALSVAPPGRVCDRLCELRDILPTLCCLAGADKPAFSDGENLLDASAGRAFLHGEHAYGALSSQFIVTKRDKYIWFSQTGREQYFDLSLNYREAHNAVNDAACQARIARLRDKLIDALTGREEGYVKDGRLVPGRRPVNRLEHPLCGEYESDRRTQCGS